MLKVFYNPYYSEEKKYVLNLIFSDVLGLDFELCEHEYVNYKIIYNGKEIIINDAFFSQIKLDEKYYEHNKYLPKSCKILKTSTLSEDDLCVIYGDEELQIDDAKVYVGADLIASTFFMLTRWEENILPKDNHDRAVESELFAVKFGVHRRAIVNEYIEFIRLLLRQIFGIDNANKRTFKATITHDIDLLLKYSNPIRSLKILAGDIIKRKTITGFWTNLVGMTKCALKIDKDPYDTYDMLMDLSEARSLNSIFYFMAGNMGERDVDFELGNKSAKKVINNIIERGHTFGIHPTYDSYNSRKKIHNEVKRIREIYANMSESRQHFLRLSIPETFRYLNDSLIKYDSTLGFNSDAGFRCGYCYEFPIFDYKYRQLLDIRERPLILMDIALQRQCMDEKSFYSNTISIIDEVKKYSGDFVLLWHNNYFTQNEWTQWEKLYVKILDYLV